jgi:hypothetical protein
MLKITGADELKAAAAYYGRLDAPTKKAVRSASQSFAPRLKRAAAARARGPVDRRIAQSGKVTVNNKGLVAVFGSTGRLPSGEPLRTVAAPYEFGSGRRQTTTTYLSRQRQTRSAMRVERRTKVQLPGILPTGRFLFPAVADVTPELVSAWLKALADVARDRP